MQYNIPCTTSHNTTQHDVRHASYGLVRAEDGRRYRSRSGDIVALEELLAVAKEEGEAILKQYNREQKDKIRSSSLSSTPLDDLHPSATFASGAEIGVNAVKYLDLSQRRETDYNFAFKRALDFKANTVVYVLYAYSRLCGVLSKTANSKGETRTLGHPFHDLAHVDWSVLQSDSQVQPRRWAPQQRRFALSIAHFPSILLEAERTLYPHLLCEYLQHLSSSFHSFYEQCAVRGSEEEER